MGGRSRETGRDGRDGRGVKGHASAPLCGLLLGDADGALHSSASLRGPLPATRRLRGTPQVRSKARATSFWLGATLLLELAWSAGILPRWADSTSLLGPDFLRSSGRGLAFACLATSRKSPRVVWPGW